MNKYEFTWSCRDNNAFGFINDIECMDMIIDKWTEENGGRMNADELAEMVEYIEDEMYWWWMGHLMHGYLWGAAIDDKMELLGERVRNERMNRTMNKYAAVIYDHHNIVERVEERPTRERADKAGQFWTRMTGWYKVVEGEEEIEMYKSMINM